MVQGRARRESGSGVEPHAAQGRMPREAVFSATPTATQITSRGMKIASGEGGGKEPSGLLGAPWANLGCPGR